MSEDEFELFSLGLLENGGLKCIPAKTNLYEDIKCKTFYKLSLKKEEKTRIQTINNFKCYLCHKKNIHNMKYLKLDNIEGKKDYYCFNCLIGVRTDRLCVYYLNKEAYYNDPITDLGTCREILENYIYEKETKIYFDGKKWCDRKIKHNIFGEEQKYINLNEVHYQVQYLNRFKNKLRIKTNDMFWAIFELNKIKDTKNIYYLPTEIIMEIIYHTMYWIPNIKY